MHHFQYRAGILHAEDVNLETIATEVGTPVYVYSTATLERHYRVLREAFDGMICYALKANDNLAVVRTLARLGAGADTVSEGEIRKALAAGIPAERIVFSGVGKSERELAFAVATGVHQISVESPGELDVLDQVGRSLGRRQPIVLRVNPDVAAGGHAKISTGTAESKFGVGIDEAIPLFEHAATLEGVEPRGLAVHIGSQIEDLAPFESAFLRLRGLIEDLQARGYRADRLDLGGGLGVPYDHAAPAPPSPAAYGALVRRVLDGLPVDLATEPGRLIAANAGILLARVLYVNQRPSRKILVLDAAMNDLIRPAMYEAHHDIVPVRERASAGTGSYDVVGPVCESGDTFAVNRTLPIFHPGDLAAFMTAGAYSASMSSTYNARPLVAEVLVNGGEWEVVRPRQTYEDLIGRDRTPSWLSET